MTSGGVQVPSDGQPSDGQPGDFRIRHRPRVNGLVVRDRQRAEVILRYARLVPSGRKPVYCTPSRAELSGAVARKQGRGTDGKVIYPDREAADAAGRELEALGARPLRSYPCQRSRHGHFHLTTDWPAVWRARAASRSRVTPGPRSAT